MSLPFTSTFPELGVISLLSRRISVDFPLPDRPMMQNISPRRTCRLALATPTTQLNSFSTSVFPRPRALMDFIAAADLSPKTFQSDWQSIRTSLVSAFAAFIAIPLSQLSWLLLLGLKVAARRHRTATTRLVLLMFSQRLIRSAWAPTQPWTAWSIVLPSFTVAIDGGDAGDRDVDAVP